MSPRKQVFGILTETVPPVSAKSLPSLTLGTSDRERDATGASFAAWMMMLMASSSVRVCSKSPEQQSHEGQMDEL